MHVRLFSSALAFSFVALLSAACAPADSSSSRGNSDGDGDGDSSGEGDGGGVGDLPATGGSMLDLGDTGGTGGSVEKPPAELVETLPTGFITGPPGVGTITGAYMVLGPIEEFTEPAENSCKNVLRAIVRDFDQSHIDFGQEKPVPWTAPGLYQGHILDTLGDSRKPEVNPARMPLDVMESFGDWYQNIEMVNVPYVMDIWLEPDPANPGTFVFDTTEYFPLDEYIPSEAELQAGVGGLRNFGFTTELHTAFEYKGGEVFNFRGDDDVFVFIDGKLAVDLGGIHNALEANISLDTFATMHGLEIGQVYQLDLFQAERNPGASNFRIETSLDFQECGILETDIVVR